MCTGNEMGMLKTFNTAWLAQPKVFCVMKQWAWCQTRFLKQGKDFVIPGKRIVFYLKLHGIICNQNCSYHHSLKLFSRAIKLYIICNCQSDTWSSSSALHSFIKQHICTGVLNGKTTIISPNNSHNSIITSYPCHGGTLEQKLSSQQYQMSVSFTRAVSVEDRCYTYLKGGMNKPHSGQHKVCHHG